jgi:hypothetical protein
MKNITYILVFALGIATAQAQTIDSEVVATAGETISNGILTLDQTLGDLAVTDITNGTTTLQQGFQQTRVELKISLNPIAFLQGAGTNPVAGEESLMRDDLRSSGLLPTTSPYDTNISVDTTVFDVIGMDAIVDWVEVELRQGADNDNTVVVESVSAFLQRDGDIVALDGFSGLVLEVASGDYYVAINHRNHLGVLTNAPITLSNLTTTADFTSDASFIKNGPIAASTLANGNLALIAGDASEDNQIFTSDISLVTPVIGSIPTYASEDINMDGQFFTNDISLFIQLNIGKGQQF